MPSQRKRIGFLPREEVQNIIDRICEHNKLSQSKVTGILVEEALSSRGVLKDSLNNKLSDHNSYENKSLLISNNLFNKKINIDNDNLNLDETNMKDEVQMINDFIEFKFFKNIMNKNKKKF
tara:strand:- start:70 stop:432 length:363 start_codon:yes stop_codon:yes gene_type:complete